MSTYDILKATLVCPRCGVSGEYEIEAFFPSGNLFQYEIGDELVNVTRNKLKDNFIAEGYVECPHCKKDFFVDIQVEDKIITKISIKAKNGYIP